MRSEPNPPIALNPIHQGQPDAPAGQATSQERCDSPFSALDHVPFTAASGIRGVPAVNPVPRNGVSEARSAAAAPSRAVSTAGCTGVLAPRSPSASSASFSSGLSVSISVSVDLPINRLKKLNMVCSGGGGAFYRCRRNRVAASNDANKQTQRWRWLPCREKPPKTAGRAGRMRKKSERHVFYQPAPIVVSGRVANPCIGRGGAVVTCPHRRHANSCNR